MNKKNNHNHKNIKNVKNNKFEQICRQCREFKRSFYIWSKFVDKSSDFKFPLSIGRSFYKILQFCR